jgi:hypothetical protein
MLQASLGHYTESLNHLGCVDIEDLRELDESDFTDKGMNKIECGRLQRKLLELK